MKSCTIPPKSHTMHGHHVVLACLLVFFPSAASVEDETCLLQLQRGRLDQRGNSHEIAKAEVVVTTLAGSGEKGVEHGGGLDGVGTKATFNAPYGIGISPDGTFALVGEEDGNAVRRINISTAEVVTLAGGNEEGGDVDGPAAVAQFNKPHGVAVAPDGTYALLAESDTNKVRKISLPSGSVSTLAGNGSDGFQDGVGTGALFNSPHDVAISSDGVFALVADTNNGAVRKVEIATGAVTSVDCGYGPIGVAISPDDSFALVADPGSNGVKKLDFSVGACEDFAGGDPLKGAGSADGIGTAAQFDGPFGVAFAPCGKFALVTDHSNQKIRKLTIASREVETLAGTGVQATTHEVNGTKVVEPPLNGVGSKATFNHPAGIDIAPDGTYALVVDYGVHHAPFDIRRVELTTMNPAHKNHPHMRSVSKHTSAIIILVVGFVTSCILWL